MPSLLDLIALVDNAPHDIDLNNSFYPLVLLPDPRPHGFIHPNILAALPFHPPLFETSHSPRRIALSPPPAGTSLAAHATSALQQIVDAAIQSPLFPTISAHSEPFLLVGARDVVTIERFAASLFGIATRGAHMTAYVRRSASRISSSASSSPSAAAPSASTSNSEKRTQTHDIRGIWVAKRSAHLATYPGLWDSTVAGGVKAHNSPAQCIRDEALEEASLPDHARARIQPTGALTLANINARGLFHSEILYVYDLDLTPRAHSHRGRDKTEGEDEDGGHIQDYGSEEVVPRPGDDEVERFVLMSCDEIVQRMRAGEFKPNVCPVIIDFLLRHGVITPDTESDYADICARLHRRLPVPLMSDL